MPKHSVCAEIGVWKGDFSREILKIVHPKELHLIDPWKYLPEYKNRWYGGAVAESQEDMDKIYEKVKMEFDKDKRVKIHRGYSNSVAKQFKDDYFDWIYIDGNHSYEFVLADIKNFLPKIKKGGFILGDDYWWGIKEGFPVRRAVRKVIKDDLVEKVQIKSRLFWLRKN